VADAEIVKTGEVLFQKPHTVVFGFTNKGDKPLHIKKVHPSCGCAKASYTRGNIAPGERGEITVVYDAGILGTFSKYVEVYTNAGKDPEFLVFQGRVVRELSDYAIGFPIDLGNVRMNTNYIEFDNVVKGQVLATELKVVNTERTAYSPELMHLPPYLRAEYDPKDIPGGKTGVVRLILDSDKLTHYGLNQTSVYLARYSGDKIGEGNEIAVSAVLHPQSNTQSSSIARTRNPAFICFDMISHSFLSGFCFRCHIVKAVFAGIISFCGHQCVKCLFGSHGVYFSSGRMHKSFAFYIAA
jgi:hypothetical protein